MLEKKLLVTEKKFALTISDRRFKSCSKAYLGVSGCDNSRTLYICILSD